MNNGGDSHTSPYQQPTPDSTAAWTLSWAHANNVTTWFSRETTSTNTIAKSRVSFAAPSASAEPTTLFLTERQTAGRGRGEHTWTNPKGALLSTWVTPMTFAPQPVLSPLLGLALFDATRHAFGSELPFNLKAPNDLYAGSQKMAGLLIETVVMGSIVTCAVGLGFNAQEAPSSLGAQAVGLTSLVPIEKIRERWPIFLTAWADGLANAIALSRNSELSVIARERLLTALNLHPLLKEKVLSVGPMGQIQTDSRLIDWSEL